MDRTTARAHAMKLIYEWEMGGEGGVDTRLQLLEIKPDEKECGFMESLFSGVTENVADLDSRITAYARGWTTDRMSRVDLAILRLAVYELTRTKTPGGIVINEAVELAKQYSTDKAAAFVNGVLGNLSRDLN